jgi:glycosyltransferase involved in cell wall biosynthesis
LHKNRGTETLYRAYAALAAADANLHFAIAGPRGRNDKLPTGARVHDFGQVPQSLVPTFLNALDVAVVCNRDTVFSRFNFPQKAREILACGTPIVAASVGTMQEMLRQHPECLYTPDDPASLLQALRHQLRRPTRVNQRLPSWADIAVQLESFLQKVLQERGKAVRT